MRSLARLAYTTRRKTCVSGMICTCRYLLFCFSSTLQWTPATTAPPPSPYLHPATFSKTPHKAFTAPPQPDYYPHPPRAPFSVAWHLTHPLPLHPIGPLPQFYPTPCAVCTVALLVYRRIARPGVVPRWRQARGGLDRPREQARADPPRGAWPTSYRCRGFVLRSVPRPVHQPDEPA